MAGDTIIPGVGTLSSTALTTNQVETLIQALVLQSLGVDVTTVADAYALVRVDWPTNGQPDWKVQEDIAFLRVTEADEPYNAAHEDQPPGSGDIISTPYGEIGYGESAFGNETEEVISRTIYTRAWDVYLIFYGPNSYDRARQVKSCLYLDFVSTKLAQSNLYEIPVIGTPRRVPELFQAQWWQRTDFSFRMYEQVTETLTVPTLSGVELIIADATGFGSDIVVAAPQQ